MAGPSPGGHDNCTGETLFGVHPLEQVLLTIRQFDRKFNDDLVGLNRDSRHRKDGSQYTMEICQESYCVRNLRRHRSVRGFTPGHRSSSRCGTTEWSATTSTACRVGLLMDYPRFDQRPSRGTRTDGPDAGS